MTFSTFLFYIGVMLLLIIMLFFSLRHINAEIFRINQELSSAKEKVEEVTADLVIPIVLSEGAFMPKRKHGDEDACYDIICPKDIPLSFGRSVIPTGIRFSTPIGVVALILPTSGNTIKGLAVQSKKGDSVITDYRINGDTQLGVIDPGYTGEIGVMFNNHLHPKKTESEFVIKRGTKLGQILFVKTEKAHFKPVKELDETTRGSRGYGSTDYDCMLTNINSISR